jgi:hypothetical protein
MGGILNAQGPSLSLNCRKTTQGEDILAFSFSQKKSCLFFLRKNFGLHGFTFFNFLNTCIFFQFDKVFKNIPPLLQCTQP